MQAEAGEDRGVPDTGTCEAALGAAAIAFMLIFGDLLCACVCRHHCFSAQGRPLVGGCSDGLQPGLADALSLRFASLWPQLSDPLPAGALVGLTLAVSNGAWACTATSFAGRERGREHQR